MLPTRSPRMDERAELADSAAAVVRPGARTAQRAADAQEQPLDQDMKKAAAAQ